MSETIANPVIPQPAEAELRRSEGDPKGVLPKNLKPWLYAGASIVVIAAAFFSGTGKKTATQQGAGSHQAPQPFVQDNTDNNAQELRSTATAAEQKMAQQGIGATDPAVQNTTPAQQAAAAAYGPNGQAAPCVAGRPCAQQQEQLSPA